MMLTDEVVNWLESNQYGRVVANHPVGGGCINNGERLETESGETFFLKTNPNAPGDMFAREAEGLDVLGKAGGPRVPKPYIFGQYYLLLEDLAPASPQSNFWTKFGRQLAEMHNHVHPQFGFFHDNYIGSTPQSNSWTDDGFQFFGEQRLMFQAKLAGRRNLLQADNIHRVEKLAKRLEELVPHQPASLLHGDLWSGNAIADVNGQPAIIDPAAYYGWAEAELAMTTLFGSFPGEFYSAYQEVRKLEPGFRSRYAVYNLYHLLNHLNLFGRGYLSQVLGVLDRFV